MSLDLVKAAGFALVKNIFDTKDLISLAQSVGKMVPNSRGELVQTLRVSEKEAARPNSLSARHGRADFPFHTDTAFWITPAQYLVMRCAGDLRRGTSVTLFRSVFEGWEENRIQDAKQSVWRIIGVDKPFYCGLFFGSIGQQGCRFDSECMVPTNCAAKSTAKVMQRSLARVKTDWINWSEGTAAIIANWHALHGRGPEPPNEKERTIERIYVR